VKRSVLVIGSTRRRSTDSSLVGQSYWVLVDGHSLACNNCLPLVVTRPICHHLLLNGFDGRRLDSYQPPSTVRYTVDATTLLFMRSVFCWKLCWWCWEHSLS